jgi:hypothetical protein
MRNDGNERWALPEMHTVEWEKNRLPACMEDIDIWELIGRMKDNEFVVVADDPMLHRFDDGDGTPPVAFWRARCLLVAAGPSRAKKRICALRVTSVSMLEDGDTVQSVSRDFGLSVTESVASLQGWTVADVR